MISPFCGIEIIRAFRRVNGQRDLQQLKYPFGRKNPTKPAWCLEGDVFCDLWEGFTYFSIGRESVVGGRIVVEANLEHREGGESCYWTDRVVLDRDGQNWVIADIRYSRGGSLLESIGQELARNAKYLNIKH